MAVSLVFVNPGPEQGMVVSVTRSPFIIGRRPDAHLRTDNKKVSGHHCALVVARDGVFLRDLQSHNGTFLNGERVESSAALHDGDCIKVGPLALEVHMEDVGPRVTV